jgi:hypothetical protein
MRGVSFFIEHTGPGEAFNIVLNLPRMAFIAPPQEQHMFQYEIIHILGLIDTNYPQISREQMTDIVRNFGPLLSNYLATSAMEPIFDERAASEWIQRELGYQITREAMMAIAKAQREFRQYGKR